MLKLAWCDRRQPLCDSLWLRLVTLCEVLITTEFFLAAAARAIAIVSVGELVLLQQSLGTLRAPTFFWPLVSC